MDLFSGKLDATVNQMLSLLQGLPEEQLIEKLNEIKKKIHEISPFNDEPVDCVIWVKNDRVRANNYNPNKVAPPEMSLLKHSINSDGYTQPIVTFADQEEFEVVDGFHRKRVGMEYKSVRDRVKGYLPITLIKHNRLDIKDRMAATIRHNRARGVHGVIPMIDIVKDLILQGWKDDEIAKELGMDAEEVLRFKQNSGLPELFKDHEYSKSWE